MELTLKIGSKFEFQGKTWVVGAITKWPHREGRYTVRLDRKYENSELMEVSTSGW